MRIKIQSKNIDISSEEIQHLKPKLSLFHGRRFSCAGKFRNISLNQLMTAYQKAAKKPPQNPNEIKKFISAFDFLKDQGYEKKKGILGHLVLLITKVKHFFAKKERDRIFKALNQLAKKSKLKPEQPALSPKKEIIENRDRLKTLPHEVLAKILQSLNPIDFLSFSMTSKEYGKIVQEAYFKNKKLISKIEYKAAKLIDQFKLEDFVTIRFKNSESIWKSYMRCFPEKFETLFEKFLHEESSQSKDVIPYEFIIALEFFESIDALKASSAFKKFFLVAKQKNIQWQHFSFFEFIAKREPEWALQYAKKMLDEGQLFDTFYEITGLFWDPVKQFEMVEKYPKLLQEMKNVGGLESVLRASKSMPPDQAMMTVEKVEEMARDLQIEMNGSLANAYVMAGCEERALGFMTKLYGLGKIFLKVEMIKKQPRDNVQLVKELTENIENEKLRPGATQHLFLEVLRAYKEYLPELEAKTITQKILKCMPSEDYHHMGTLKIIVETIAGIDPDTASIILETSLKGVNLSNDQLSMIVELFILFDLKKASELVEKIEDKGIKVQHLLKIAQAYKSNKEEAIEILNRAKAITLKSLDIKEHIQYLSSIAIEYSSIDFAEAEKLYQLVCEKYDHLDTERDQLDYDSFFSLSLIMDSQKAFALVDENKKLRNVDKILLLYNASEFLQLRES